VSGVTLVGIDYHTGSIYTTAKGSVTPGTITFTFAKRCRDNTMYVAANANNTLSSWDILNARAKMVAQHFSPNVLIVHDNDIPGLLYDEKLKFLEQSAYGSREAILNAEIGKIFGMKVLTSAITHMAEGHAIYVDTRHLGYHITKRDMRGYREDKPEFDAVWYHMWAEENYGVVNNTAIAISTNHGPSSGTLKVKTA